MTVRRRDALLGLGLGGFAVLRRAGAAADGGLVFPADFGAHPAQRTEWWYLTGRLAAGPRQFGFQVTFFRSATGVAADNPSRFAARELVFAHAALTDLSNGRFVHDQRIARSGFGVAHADRGDTAVTLRDWRMARSEAAGRSRYRTVVASDAAGFRLDLVADATQPVLLQGDAGVSRKGPLPGQTSRYYSEPQLAMTGSVAQRGPAVRVTGRAWLDHEWSDAFLDPAAVGWDWIGMNLDDGGALTAFRLRRADGTTVYAGGSFRAAGAGVRDFAADAVRFAPGRAWTSGASRARYPVEWTVDTPAGRFQVHALQDDQELDSRGSTGSVYWEGISALLDASGRPIGGGYLEMTGYAAALRL